MSAFLRTLVLAVLSAAWLSPEPAFSRPQAEPGPARVSIQRVDVGGLPEVHVYLSITGPNGASIIGLTDREISVACDGVPQPVDSVRSVLQGGESMAVVLLVDRSGSIAAAISQAREAAAGFVRRLTEDDEIGVVTFDETVSLDHPLAKDRAGAEKAIRAITAGSNTVLFDAIGAGLAEVKKASAKRLALIVLSDGKDTRSRTTLAEAVAGAKAEGVAVFTVGLGNKVDKAVLRELAEATGGRFFAASQPEDLLALYQTVGEQLENQYHLVFRPSFGQDEAWHQMEIKVVPPGSEGPATAGREFIATRGPGVSRATLGGFERRVAERRYLLGGGVGGLFGVLFGLLLGMLVRLLRPDLKLGVVSLLGLVLLGAVLGGLVGIILVSTS